MTRPALRRLCCLMMLVVCAAAAPAMAQTQTQAKGIDRSAGGDDQFTLNLKDADITTLIATVSEVTGRNFVVDPRVKGNVTVLSNEAMTPRQLYETFLSVLDVHGFAAVPSGEVTKIIPQINAKQDGGFGGRGGATREDIVTRVIKVDNVPADQLVPILRPLVPQYGHLAAYSASNTLIVSDREANAQRIADIVAKIDRNGTHSVETIRLQYASADDVASTVEKLKSSGKGKAASSSFSIVPDARTNSVIISGGKQQRLRLRAIIADLDTQTEQTGGTQVIYLDYADAESLAPILQNYADGRGASGQGSSTPGAKKTAASSAPTPVGGGDNGISVIADPASNALVVTAPADSMRQIRKVVDQLDIRRGQVLVEAIIAEVSLSRSRKLGVNIAAFNGNTPAAASILDQNTLRNVGPAVQNGTPLNLIQQGLNVALGDVGGDTGFAILVNALSSNTNTNVLSTPSLITRDNEEAEIKVGQEVPFVTGSYTNGGVGGAGGLNNNSFVNPFNTVERKDVGLTLGITPQISAGKTVQLTIDQEISSIAQNATASTGAVDLITNNRTLNTSVEVEDGQILVIGGLIDDKVTETQSKVPLLGDIPLLGALFRNRSVDKRKRNLLNFIRPTILRGGGEADYYTRKKYKYLRSLQEQQAESSIPLMSEAQRPQLPPIERYDDRDSFSSDSGVSGDSGTKDRTRRADKRRRGDQF